jgi:membrane-bound ClpP family serine protease
LKVSREDWLCLGLIIFGIVFFLVGANIYNALIGWFGVFLFLGGILALIMLYVYSSLSKPRTEAEPQPEPAQTP